MRWASVAALEFFFFSFASRSRDRGRTVKLAPKSERHAFQCFKQWRDAPETFLAEKTSLAGHSDWDTPIRLWQTQGADSQLKALNTSRFMSVLLN